MKRTHNYVDDKGNYQNVENLTLREIYNRGYKHGVAHGKISEQKQRGEWIEHDNYAECSKCHSLFTYFGNFCGNCGADMRGEGI